MKHRFFGLAIVAVLAILAAAGGAQQVGAGGNSCTVTPTLRDSAVDQGVGGATAAAYSPLVRGKDALVRFYLSGPSCSSSQLQILDASLTATITNADGTTQSIGPFRPVNPLVADVSGNYPVISPYSTGPVAADTTSDPKFVIPGYQLVAKDANAFRVSFALSGHFRVGATGASTVFPPSGSIATTASFDKQTRALRVLVVKMGDPNGIGSASACPAGVACTTYPDLSGGVAQHPEFGDRAVSAFQNAMSALSRVAPVPGASAAGLAPTGDLSGINGGLRYTFNVVGTCGVTTSSCGMLNLAAIIDANGAALLGPFHPFCGNSGNFTLIQPQLTSMLNNWNAANPNATADRVVGVVDGSVATGTSGGCAGGMAAFNSNAAWVRVDPAATNTGAVLAMELGHTLGVVPASRSRTGSTYHSKFTEADNYLNASNVLTDAQRAYNVTNQSYLGSDRTVMYASDANWTTDNVAYEAADFGVIRCQLGGATTSDCTTAGTVGTGTGVAQGPHFSIAGSVKPDGSQFAVTESFFADASVFPSIDPLATSTYHLVQRQGDTILHNDPLPVACDTSNHDHDSGGGLTTTIDQANCFFASSYDDYNTNTTQIEVWNGAPGATACTSGTASCVYVRHVHPQPTTTVTTHATVGTVKDLTPTHTFTDNQSALTSDGKWIAFQRSDGTNVRIAVGPSNKASFTYLPAATGPQSDPAWNRDHSAIAYVVDGNLWTVPVTQLGGAGGSFFGTPVKLFNAPTSDNPVSSPSWSPDGTQIVFDVFGALAGELWTVNSDGSNPAGLDLGVSGDEPSWSQTAGDNRIAFVRQVPGCPTECQTVPTIFLLDPSNPTDTITPLHVGHAPSWGPNGQIAYEDSTGIRLINSDGSGDGIAVAGPGGEPSLATDKLSFEADPDDSNNDIFVASFDGTHVTIKSTPSDNLDPSQLMVDMYYSCGGVNYPVSRLSPTVSTSGDATFAADLGGGFTCANGTIKLIENDGLDRWDITSAAPAPISVIGSDAPPVATINTPADGKQFLQYSGIPLAGVAKSAGGELSGDKLDWKLSGPGLVTTDVGTGSIVNLPNTSLPLPAGGWAPGSYTLTLTATDADGTDTATTHFTVAADTNDDGLPDSLPCVGTTTGAAFADGDHDGIPNIEDARPCTADVSSDTLKPTITVGHAANTNGQNTNQPVTVNVHATDPATAGTADTPGVAGGLRSVSCTVDGGPVFIPGADTVWGTTSFDGSFTVSGLQKHPIVCTATDAAYNSTSANDLVWIVTPPYTFIGFQPPVNNAPTVNMGTAGRTYPVKWQLKNAAGAYVSDLNVVVNAKDGLPDPNLEYKAVTCGAFSGDPTDALEAASTGGSVLRYDGGSNTFVYNWQTPSTKGCYVLYLLLNDGSTRQANFQLK